MYIKHIARSIYILCVCLGENIAPMRRYRVWCNDPPGNHNSSLTILIFELTTLTIPILSPFLFIPSLYALLSLIRRIFYLLVSSHFYMQEQIEDHALLSACPLRNPPRGKFGSGAHRRIRRARALQAGKRGWIDAIT